MTQAIEYADSIKNMLKDQIVYVDISTQTYTKDANS